MDKRVRNLVFIGDSLTEYYDWQQRFPEDRVSNLGVAGETVDGLKRRLPAILAEISDPDFIFVMTGINDVAMEDFDILTVYEQILREIRSRFPSPVLAVQSLLPVILPWIDKGVIERLNRALETVARECGAEYLDLYVLFTDRGGSPIKSNLLEDGVHLSGEGYEIWGKAVEEFIGAKA